MNNDLEISKVELLGDLIKYFPDKANEIFYNVEKSSESTIKNFDENKKIDYIFQVISEDENLIEDETIFLIEIASYLEKMSPATITEQVLNKFESIISHELFSNSEIKIPPEEILLLKDSLKSISDDFNKVSNQLTLELNNHLYYFNRLDFVITSKESEKLKSHLQMNIKSLINEQSKLFQISREIYSKLIIIEQKISLLNKQEEIVDLYKRFGKFRIGLKEIFKKQDDILEKFENLQFQTSEDIYEFFNICQEFSTYFLVYSNIKSYISSFKMNKLHENKLKEIQQDEETFLLKYKHFIDKSRRLINKHIPEPDKINLFKNRFVLPYQEKFDKESYSLFLEFLDSLV